MPISFEVNDASAFAALDGADDRVMDRFAELLRPVEQAMLDDARSRAIAHFHSVGKKPGLYLGAFAAGVSRKDSGVVGWLRNANNLAHLLEYGFTISDLVIEASGAMRFDVAGVGELYRREVHRHATPVQAYPAIHPALAARADEVLAAAEQAAKGE
jgi:hypothetical protein